MEKDYTAVDRAALEVGKGNMQAFERIYGCLFNRTIHMIRLYVMDLNEHEDVLQDLMILCIKLCKKYNPDRGHFEHYAYRTFRFTLLKRAEKPLRYHNILRPTSYVKTEYLNVVDTYEFHQPEDRILAREFLKEFLKRIENSDHFSTLERSVLSGLMNGQSPLEVRETLNIDETSYTNTFYRMRKKAKYHPLLHTIDNDSHNSYSI